MMPLPSADPHRAHRTLAIATSRPVRRRRARPSPESTADEPAPWTPSLRSTASWVVYDLGDTVFQQTMITNYFPVWVVAVMGGADGHISLVNTITMVLMLVSVPGSEPFPITCLAACRC